MLFRVPSSLSWCIFSPRYLLCYLFLALLHVLIYFYSEFRCAVAILLCIYLRFISFVVVFCFGSWCYVSIIILVPVFFVCIGFFMVLFYCCFKSSSLFCNDSLEVVLVCDTVMLICDCYCLAPLKSAWTLLVFFQVFKEPQLIFL